MSSQPGGGPAIPAAAALSGLSDDDQDDATPRGEEAGDESHDGDFVTAGMQAPETDDDGTPVGRADAEQDRIRASDEEADAE